MSLRSSGKIQSDISATWREELPHLLPDHVAEETRTVRLVILAALDILLFFFAEVLLLLFYFIFFS